MGFLTGPEPPNPIVTAGAQTNANVQTAIANAFLNNVNQVTPTGNLNYDQTSAFNFTDPNTGAQYSIPRFTSTQTLSPNQQQLAQQREGAQIGLATVGNTEAQRLNQLLSGNVNLSTAPHLGDPNTIGSILSPSSSFGDAGAQLTSYGPADDFSSDRARVEQALYGRLNPQLERERAGVEQRLADQGIRYGSPAYARAMDDYNRQANDMRLAVTQTAGQEQQRMMDMAAQRAGFSNAAQAAMFQQAQARGQFGNAALAQQLSQRQAALNAQNQTRNQYLAELYAARNQPINEISALLSGSQLTQPQWANWNQAQVPTTDIAGLINQNFSQQSANAQMQSQLLGNVIGAGGRLGSAALIGSDRRMKDVGERMGTVFAADTEGERKALPIYEYAYKDDPTSTRHVGPMAQDVEKIDKGAVKTIRGVKHIKPDQVMGSIMRAA